MASLISEDSIKQELLQRLQHIYGSNGLDRHTEKLETLT